MNNSTRPIPKTTLAVFAVTAIVTALTFPYPHLIAALERTPTMLAHREWWRFITPVFINPEGWRQIVANAVGLLVLGAIVEREFRAARWLAIYFSSAVVGEIAGCAWRPNSAGSSVGVCRTAGRPRSDAADFARTASPRRRLRDSDRSRNDHLVPRPPRPTNSFRFRGSVADAPPSPPAQTPQNDDSHRLTTHRGTGNPACAPKHREASLCHWRDRLSYLRRFAALMRGTGNLACADTPQPGPLAVREGFSPKSAKGQCVCLFHL